jgi:spore cortex formation protein SpoVR/YcgB (stage V sporulation)
MKEMKKDIIKSSIIVMYYFVGNLKISNKLLLPLLRQYVMYFHPPHLVRVITEGWRSLL